MKLKRKEKERNENDSEKSSRETRKEREKSGRHETTQSYKQSTTTAQWLAKDRVVMLKRKDINSEERELEAEAEARR